MAQAEYIIQREFVKYMKLQHPKVLFCASAGGLQTSLNQGQKMKAAGYRKGFPDMAVLEPVGAYKGLFIEIKAAGGRISPEQLAWVQKLNERGYYATVCKGLGECLTVFEKYLQGRV
jgi:hypothetical protein